MTRFFGRIGYYTGELVETSPGVYNEGIIEKEYRGDITRVSSKLGGNDSVNGVISLNHRISIVADAYAFSNFFNIRYVVWRGIKWTVGTIEVDRPRIVLYIGSEYQDAP